MTRSSRTLEPALEHQQLAGYATYVDAIAPLANRLAQRTHEQRIAIQSVFDGARELLLAEAHGWLGFSGRGLRRDVIPVGILLRPVGRGWHFVTAL
ncbi:MAG: hypothetical protein AMJ58_10475 [Gammaproteobacteria bacterium SG8_30]|nr:MAG: hypothetical protein AMJ58_10475 [Gammaproteobacteria bacterium SG8_30]